MLGLLRVLRAFRTVLFDLITLTASVAFLTTFTRYCIVVVSTLKSDILGIAPKTKRVGIRPLGLVESLVAFSAILSRTSFSSRSSTRSIDITLKHRRSKA